MANHPSALKAHRQSLTRKRRNKSNRSQLRTALKKFSEQAKTGKTDDGCGLHRLAVLDRRQGSEERGIEQERRGTTKVASHAPSEPGCDRSQKSIAFWV